MVVAHNLVASNAYRNLGVVTSTQKKSTEKLSSGYKINRSADDAAGLSISEKMRSQIRGLTQASSNCQDGVSLVQIAEGALGEVHSMLQRMNELSVKAANGTNTEADRQAIQDEMTNLVSEIDRVAQSTQFNTMNLLNGEDASNAGAGLSSVESKKVMTLDDLNGIDGVKIFYVESDVDTTQSASGSTGLSGTKYDTLKSKLETQIVPQAVNAVLTAAPLTFGYLASSSIGIGLVLENKPSSSTLASVTMGASYYPTSPIQAASLSYTLTVNIASLGSDLDLNNKANRDALESTIIHEMTHALMDETLTNGMMGNDGVSNSLSTSAQYPGWFKEGSAQAMSGGYLNSNDWVNGGLGITTASTDTQISNALKSNSLSSGSTASKYGTGYLASMYLAYKQSGGATVDQSHLANGFDAFLNELKSGTSLNDAVKNVTGKTLSQFESSFATDSDVINFVKSLTSTVTSAGSGGLATGSSFTTGADALPDTPHSLNLFKLNTSNGTVSNVYPSDYPVFSGGSKNTAGTPAPTTGGSYSPITPGTIPPGTPPVYEEFTGDYADFVIQAGAANHEEQRIRIRIEKMDAEALGVNDVDVTTQENAQNSIAVINDAIQIVSRQRSSLGADQNRLEHTISNLDNIVENTTSAESQIRDTDMAKEMVEFTKNNILAQAGTSMLSQANQSAQNVLSLLQ